MIIRKLIKLKQVLHTLYIFSGVHQATQVLRTLFISFGAHQAKASSSQAHQAAQVSGY